VTPQFYNTLDSVKAEAPDEKTRASIFHSTSKSMRAYELAEKKAAEEKRIQKRLENCGKWGLKHGKHSNSKKRVMYECGLWRGGLCPRCLRKRAETTRQFFVNAVATKNIRKIEVSPDRAKKLIRKMKKHQYERYPLDGETELLFFEAEALPEMDNSSPVKIKDVIGMDWEKIVNVPEKTNKSGTLSMPPSPESPEKFEMISVETVVSNAPPEAEDILFDEAQAETAQMNPTTPKQVERCIKKRMRIYRKKLINAGYLVFTHSRMEKCYSGRIDWTKSG